MLNALIMAGSSKSGLLEEQEGVENKVFVKIEGRYMIEIILDVVSSHPGINRILVVGDAEKLEKLKEKGYQNIEIVPQVGGLFSNALEGVSHADPHEPCIIVTADIPLLTGEIFEEFLNNCKPYDHDFYYPVITKADCLQQFPTAKRTYVTMKEGPLTGGNVMIVKPDWIVAKKELITKYISYRKKPLKALSILPPGIIIKYLTRRLSISDMEKFFAKLIGVKGKTIITSRVEIGVDVDKPEDLELVREVYRMRTGSK